MNDLKSEGVFSFKNDPRNRQVGKGGKVSYRWSGKALKKISENLGKIFPNRPKIKCDVCKKIVKTYTTIYHNNGTTTTTCSDCKK